MAANATRLVPGLWPAALAILMLSTRPVRRHHRRAVGERCHCALGPGFPATILLSVLSAPVYMWLHTQGPVPAVLGWLGGVVLVAAVAGCHMNAALLIVWQRTRKLRAEDTGLRDFLFRHGQHK